MICSGFGGVAGGVIGNSGTSGIIIAVIVYISSCCDVDCENVGGYIYRLYRGGGLAELLLDWSGSCAVLGLLLIRQRPSNPLIIGIASHTRLPTFLRHRVCHLLYIRQNILKHCHILCCHWWAADAAVIPSSISSVIIIINIIVNSATLHNLDVAVRRS